MANEFWTSAGVEPKRKYRFLVQFGATGATTAEIGNLWFAKSVTKPEITVNTTEHAFMNHKFYYPGTVEWNEITLTLVDPVSPDAAEMTAQMLETAGYKGPGALKGANPVTLSKAASVDALGSVIITVVDQAGNALETWTLNNAFIIKVGYGELSYGDDELTEIELSFRYDWATIKPKTGPSIWQD